MHTRSRTSEMADGLDLAKVHLKTIFAQVQTFLDMHQVVSAGPFLYAFVQEVSVYLVTCRLIVVLPCPLLSPIDTANADVTQQ